MTAPILPSDLVRQWEAQRRYQKALKAALTNIDSIYVHPDLPVAPNLDGLCYAYWEGFERREIPALFAVALSPDLLPLARWLYEKPICPAQLSRPLGVALLETDANLAKLTGKEGRDRDTSFALIKKLREFGIARGDRSYGRNRNLSRLGPLQRRVADALTQCFTQYLSPMPTSNGVLIPSYARGLGCANRFRGSRHSPGYGVDHGDADTLRLAA